MAPVAPSLPVPANAQSWRDLFLALRDRLLGSQRFQRWATAFPLTRPVANAHAQALFDLCAGFVYSQVLFACIKLRLLEHLAEAPQTADALAPRLGLSVDATERLVDACVALDLLSRRSGGRVGLGARGAALRANPGVAAMVDHHALLYADLADPVALLRGTAAPTRMAAYWPYARDSAMAGLGAAQVGPYTALMGASQHLIADDVLAAYDIGRHRCLLDVGGGDGSFLRAAARRAPHLDLMLFDLPAVAATAQARLAQAGETAGATVVGGDFLADPLPRGADLVSLVRVLHDQDDARALTLLCAIRVALHADGTLLIAEPLAETKGAEPVGAYFAFYLLAMGRGRPRSRAAIEALLAAAGFRLVAAPPTRRPLLARVLIAKPNSDVGRM